MSCRDTAARRFLLPVFSNTVRIRYTTTIRTRYDLRKLADMLALWHDRWLSLRHDHAYCWRPLPLDLRHYLLSCIYFSICHKNRRVSIAVSYVSPLPTRLSRIRHARKTIFLLLSADLSVPKSRDNANGERYLGERQLPDNSDDRTTRQRLKSVKAFLKSTGAASRSRDFDNTLFFFFQSHGKI